MTFSECIAASTDSVENEKTLSSKPYFILYS